jgi:hypothetical protein
VTGSGGDLLRIECHLGYLLFPGRLQDGESEKVVSIGERLNFINLNVPNDTTAVFAWDHVRCEHPRRIEDDERVSGQGLCSGAVRAGASPLPPDDCHR